LSLGKLVKGACPGRKLSVRCRDFGGMKGERYRADGRSEERPPKTPDAWVFLGGDNGLKEVKDQPDSQSITREGRKREEVSHTTSKWGEGEKKIVEGKSRKGMGKGR